MTTALAVLVLPVTVAIAAPIIGSPELDVTPSETEVPADVTVAGSCPATGYDESLEEFVYPSSAQLTFAAAGVESQTVTLDGAGAFEQSFSLPAALVPERYWVTLSCDNTSVEDSVIVLPTPEGPEPSLLLDRDSASVGEEVTARGTCPRPTRATDLRVNDRTVDTVRVDPDTGEFGPVPFAVPAVDVGSAIVSTTCGGSRRLTVILAAPSPTASTPPPPSTRPTTPPTTNSTIDPTTAGPPATPTDTRIPVPDLTGLTEAEAIEKLGDSLVLGNPTGDDGRIREQDPPPGTLVEPASAVTVRLGEVDPESSTFPLLLLGLLVGAMVAGLLYSDRLRRRRSRERRWVDSQIRTDVRLHEADVDDVPDHVAGLDVRVVVSRDPVWLLFEEVGDVHH
jgi:hypothetical protein